MQRRRIVTADEQDAYSGWRKVMVSMQRPGRVKSIKRSTHRRERREGKAEIKQQTNEND